MSYAQEYADQTGSKQCAVVNAVQRAVEIVGASAFVESCIDAARPAITDTAQLLAIRFAAHSQVQSSDGHAIAGMLDWISAGGWLDAGLPEVAAMTADQRAGMIEIIAGCAAQVLSAAAQELAALAAQITGGLQE